MIKRVFKLITNEIIMGEVEAVHGENISEILIKKPFVAKDGNIMPYLVDTLMSAPAAIQIHPMNVLWSLPLDEFPDVEKVYNTATSPIIQP